MSEMYVRTTGVVMEMGLNVALDDPTQCPDKIVNLSRARTANRVCDANSINTSLRNDGVNVE